MQQALFIYSEQNVAYSSRLCYVVYVVVHIIENRWFVGLFMKNNGHKFVHFLLDVRRASDCGAWS